MNMAVDDREGFAAFLLRLRGQGAVPKALIAAFEATPRRGFISGQFHSIAWSDGMLPIECGEAIEGADLQAAVIAALAIEPGNRVLEIGTGSGYTAAVMSRLASRGRYHRPLQDAGRAGQATLRGARHRQCHRSPGGWFQRAGQ